MLLITKQEEAIRVKLMHFYESRRELSRASKTRPSPWAEKFLANEAHEACNTFCLPAGPLEFQVQLTSNNVVYRDVVHLDQQTCTCCKWDIIGI